MGLGLLLLLLLSLLGPAAAHYNLKDPMPYNRIECNPPRCHGPCPPIWKSGNARARNGPNSPSRVWSRGQTVSIAWHKNNHEGGFYRRSLVPVKYMNSASWHKRTAFEWGCFTQNKFHCGRAASCGTDHKGDAYRNSVRIPNVFPDGDYVFAQVWFGGLHPNRRQAHFSDYHTCAFVRIRGGSLHGSYSPTFVPGHNFRNNVPRGKCASTSQWAGQCNRGLPCYGNRVRMGVPGAFAHGRRPPAVYLRDLQGAMRHGPVRVSNPRGQNRAIQRSRKKARNDWKTWRKVTPRKWKPRRQRSSCWRRAPPRAGNWGRYKSRRWWNARAKYWRRRNYCKKCPRRC